MKITNELLKQAIADAEAVRETAVANAKLMLEASIAPQIKDMIARRLRVEAGMGSSTLETAAEKPHEDGEAEGGSDFPADTSAIGQGDNTLPSDDASATADIGTGPENAGTSEDDWYEDWNEADFDLGEIIKELESDIAALTAKDGEQGGDDASADDAPVAPAPDAVPAEEDEEETEVKESVDGCNQASSAADVHKYADGKLKMDSADATNSEEDDDEEEVDLEEILAELEAEEEAEKDASDKERMASKLAGLKNELAQYREAVNVLRGRLQEVNLLNAKLLFTNKLFRKEGLNNDQKVRIVESFDRATTVREVKLVYTALVENLTVAAKSFNKRTKVVTEGMASRATPSTAPKSEDERLIVENQVAERLQKLAGIL